MAKQLTTRWFEGFNVTLPFLTIKFKKPADFATGSGKGNDVRKELTNL